MPLMLLDSTSDFHVLDPGGGGTPYRGNILHPKSLPLLPRISLHLAYPISRSTFVDKKDGRNPELFHLFYLFFHDTMHMRLSCDTMLTTTTTVASFAFLLPLRKVNISDFPYSRSVKLQQRLSTEEGQ